MSENLLLQAQLYMLIKKHRALDDSIKQYQQSNNMNMLEIQRMKKQKLILKDKIAVIRRQITPDILA